jgi:hypothetical protein
MEALIYTHKHDPSNEEHAKRTDEHRCSKIVEDVDPDEERRNRVSGQLARIRALKQDVVLLQVDLNRNRDSLSSGRQAAKEAEIAILKETVAALVRPGKRVGESLPPKEQIEKRVAGYYDEIQEKLGISHNLLAREVPELLRFHEMGDCSLEAVATFNCNNNPAANMRQYVGAQVLVHFSKILTAEGHQPMPSSLCLLIPPNAYSSLQIFASSLPARAHL